MRRITLLTDFGTRDGFVAAMKGVMATLAHGAVLEDASHEIPRGDVEAASRALVRYWRLYPRGTVHLVVVDPGVGTDRRALAVEVEGRFVVAPDNGIVHHVLDEADAWEAVAVGVPPAPEGVTRASTTFHGRDVFAPVAARLAQGTALESLGRAVRDPVRLHLPPPAREEGTARGRVVTVDRFGNLGTDLPGSWVRAGSRVRIGEREIAFAAAYGSVGPDELVAVVNSDDRVEVALRDGSAASALGLGPGAPVVLTGTDEDTSG